MPGLPKWRWWPASPSAGVVGYNIYYGSQSGYYTGEISVAGTNGGVIYGIPEGVIFGYPVTTRGGGYQIVKGIEVSEFSRKRIDATLKELHEERDGVKHLLGK